MNILEELLKDIKDTQEDIRECECLIEIISEEEETARCVSISRAGLHAVKFQPHEVMPILVKRLDGLKVKLNRLQEAKDAAEKTAQGWLRFGRDV